MLQLGGCRAGDILDGEQLVKFLLGCVDVGFRQFGRRNNIPNAPFAVNDTRLIPLGLIEHIMFN